MKPYTKPITKSIVGFAEPTLSTEEENRFPKKHCLGVELISFCFRG